MSTQKENTHTKKQGETQYTSDRNQNNDLTFNDIQSNIPRKKSMAISVSIR